MLLLIDNYDSFVHNLARYFERLGQETRVVRNDAIDASGVRANGPTAIVLSPGPCMPGEAGCSVEIVRELHGVIPILGVCLGHQAIAEAFGGRTIRAAEPMHGRTSRIEHDGRGLFQGLHGPMTVGRYHSLVVDPLRVPDCLEVAARAGDGTIMALAHHERPVFGVQFHPESVLTDSGYAILANFLRIAGLDVPPHIPAIGNELKESRRMEKELPLVPVTF